ncbi:hypothetical protein J6590_031358 [Homalodisca vitripennis]|nr:hypothetical protein J6590_031358 [Homalodisca vitripennis]
MAMKSIELSIREIVNCLIRAIIPIPFLFVIYKKTGVFIRRNQKSGNNYRCHQGSGRPSASIECSFPDATNLILCDGEILLPKVVATIRTQLRRIRETSHCENNIPYITTWGNLVGLFTGTGFCSIIRIRHVQSHGKNSVKRCCSLKTSHVQSHCSDSGRICGESHKSVVYSK